LIRHRLHPQQQRGGLLLVAADWDRGRGTHNDGRKDRLADSTRQDGGWLGAEGKAWGAKSGRERAVQNWSRQNVDEQGVCLPNVSSSLKDFKLDDGSE
jgi:hypothetical protein